MPSSGKAGKNVCLTCVEGKQALEHILPELQPLPERQLALMPAAGKHARNDMPATGINPGNLDWKRTNLTFESACSVAARRSAAKIPRKRRKDIGITMDWPYVRTPMRLKKECLNAFPAILTALRKWGHPFIFMPMGYSEIRK